MEIIHSIDSMNPMVSTLVQHIMVKDNDIDAWRQELIRNRIFEAQEVKDLTEREISLLHHALMIQQLSRLSSEDLLEMADKYDIHYNIQLEDENFQMGAINY